jgi:hypothetical protein
MPTHQQIADVAGYERSSVTKMLTGAMRMSPRVKSAIDELRRREIAENYSALADDALASGEPEVAAGALRLAASKLR